MQVLAIAAAVLTTGVLASPATWAQLKKGSRFEKSDECRECHDEIATGVEVSHAPLAEGDCSACHKPHGLIGALRLQKDEPELCLDCHAPKGVEGEVAHRHPGVDKCSSCHDPHGSDHPAILHRPGRALCAIRERGSRHGTSTPRPRTAVSDATRPMAGPSRLS